MGGFSCCISSFKICFQLPWLHIHQWSFSNLISWTEQALLRWITKGGYSRHSLPVPLWSFSVHIFISGKIHFFQNIDISSISCSCTIHGPNVFLVSGNLKIINFLDIAYRNSFYPWGVQNFHPSYKSIFQFFIHINSHI